MQSRLLRVLSAAACVASLTATSYAQPAAKKVQHPSKQIAITSGAVKKLVVPPIPYTKYTLPNGLEVILSEDHTLPVVAVNVWYHVGAANEHPGLTGFAHLFEHMMFQGSLDVPSRKHIEYVEAAGGSMNGTTSFDRTNYFETLPSNQLALGLWLESDRMGFLLDTLDRAKLANQRDVVRNERRQTHEGQPYGMSNEAMYHALFPSTHPYYADVIGSHKDIESARLNDVREFFKKYYAPNNATLAIVGDFKPAEARAMIEKYFGPIKKGVTVEKPKVALPEITAEKRVTVTDTVQFPAITMAWLTPPELTPSDYTLDMAQDALGGGKSSRMYQELVYKQQIAQSANCGHDSLALAGIFECEFIARPGVKVEDLEKAADKVIADFAAEGPTKDEMQRALAGIQAGAIRPLERVGSVADVLQQFNQQTGNPGYLPTQLAKYAAVTAPEVKADFNKYITTNKRVIVITVPGEKVRDDVPQSPADTDANVKIEKQYSPEFYTAQAFRKNAPPAGPAPTLNLPVPTRFTLPNGLEVMYVSRHKLPIFSASLQNRAGSSADDPKLPGVSGFTASMLSQGTTTRSATQISNDSDAIGAFLGAGSSIETGAISISALSNNPAAAMDLFSDVALHPAFQPEEIERLRKRRMVQLMQSRDNPMGTANRVASRVLFGADSPLAYTSNGTIASNTEIKAEDLQHFYAAHYGPKNAVLILTGDVSAAEAHAWAQKYFGDWKSDAQPLAPVTATTEPTRKIILVDKPGAPQTAMFLAGLGLPRNTPDYAALSIVNPALGGTFSSRLNLKLREDKGYTYGAQSAFSYFRGTGEFLAASSIRTDVTAPAVKDTLDVLDGIKTTPLSDKELAFAKDTEIRSLPVEFQTNGSMAGAMGNIWIYSLPLDYYQKLPAELEAVTADQAKAAADAHIHTDKMYIVTVGDKAKIYDSLKSLNIAPIEEWTADGEPKK